MPLHRNIKCCDGSSFFMASTRPERTILDAAGIDIALHEKSSSNASISSSRCSAVSGRLVAGRPNDSAVPQRSVFPPVSLFFLSDCGFWRRDGAATGFLSSPAAGIALPPTHQPRRCCRKRSFAHRRARKTAAIWGLPAILPRHSLRASDCERRANSKQARAKHALC